MARRAVKFVLSDALVTESIYIGAAVFCVYAEELWGFTLLPKSNKQFHGITGRRRGGGRERGIGGFKSNRSGLKCNAILER